MKHQLIKYAKAGYPGLFLVTHEEARAEAELKAAAGEIGYKLHAWSITAGLTDTETGASSDIPDPLAALEATDNLPERSLILILLGICFSDPGVPGRLSGGVRGGASPVPCPTPPGCVKTGRSRPPSHSPARTLL